MRDSIAFQLISEAPLGGAGGSSGFSLSKTDLIVGFFEIDFTNAASLRFSKILPLLGPEAVL